MEDCDETTSMNPLGDKNQGNVIGECGDKSSIDTEYTLSAGGVTYSQFANVCNFDVVFGRGRGHSSHPGNRKFVGMSNIVPQCCELSSFLFCLVLLFVFVNLPTTEVSLDELHFISAPCIDLVQMNCDHYSVAFAPDDKRCIVKDIIHTIQISGGRFLRRGCNNWVEVTCEEARQKVTQAIQYQIRCKRSRAETASGQHSSHISKKLLSVNRNKVHSPPSRTRQEVIYPREISIQTKQEAECKAIYQEPYNGLGHVPKITYDKVLVEERAIPRGGGGLSTTPLTSNAEVTLAKPTNSNEKAPTLPKAHEPPVHRTETPPPWYSSDMSGVFSLQSFADCEDYVAVFDRQESLDAIIARNIESFTTVSCPPKQMNSYHHTVPTPNSTEPPLPSFIQDVSSGGSSVSFSWN
jgi:hypothetical protein